MSTKGLVAGLPLVAGSALISLAVLKLVFSEGFFLEWVGAFLELVPGGFVVNPVGVLRSVALVVDESVEGSGACEGSREVLPSLEVLAEAESEALCSLGYFVVV